MHELKVELSQVVLSFASRISELARLAAGDMVAHALKTEATRRRDRGGHETSKQTDDPTHAFRSLTGFFKGEARPKLGKALREFEWWYIERVLTEHKGNITHAANALGTTRQALQRKIRRLGPQRARRRRRKE